MKLCADENVTKGIVEWLRANGHDVLYAAESTPGAPDADWLARAARRCSAAGLAPRVWSGGGAGVQEYTLRSAGVRNGARVVVMVSAADGRGFYEALRR